MKKRIFSLFLCIALLLTVLPAAVFAADGEIDIITVEIPYDLTDGAAMPFDNSLLTVGDSDLYRAYLWEYSWSCQDGFFFPDPDNMPTFTAGMRYSLMVLIIPEDGVTGLDSDTAPYLSVYINGQKARFNSACSPELEEAPGKTTYAYEIDLQCPWTSVIDIIEVYGFTPPTPGAIPCGINDLSVPENAPYYIRSVIWERYNGDPAASGVTEMTEGETFAAGSTYYINVTLCPYDGYVFSADDVTWCFNGSPYNGYVDETYSYISSPTAAKLYSVDLTAEARHIDCIEIDGLGAFYEGATALSAIENVTVPAGEGYSLYFYEDTNIAKSSTSTYICDEDVFEAGENYKAIFRIIPDEGWTIDSSTVWYINGSTDYLYTDSNPAGYWYIWTNPMPCIPRHTIDKIAVYGYNYPEIGQTAGDRLTMYVVGELYEIVDAYWFCDSTSCRMTEDETFAEGCTYSACVVVRPCDPAFMISDSATCCLNDGSFPVERSGVKPDGSFYVWTEMMEAKAPGNTHTVSWYLDPTDEFAVVGVEVEDGEVFGAPAAPSKDGYTFGGWFTDRECTVPYDPAAPIYEDTDLFPLWIPETKPIDPDQPCDGGDSCPGKGFTDMPKPDDWAHAGIDFCVEKGLFGGTTETTFEPETEMTRAMLVTVLWRYEGKPQSSGTEFEDVKSDDWFADAVLWASFNGIVNGVGEGKFDPDAIVTREQLATILYRYSEWKNLPTDKRADFSEFPDAKQVSAWAETAMQWAVAEGLIGGSKEGDKTYILPGNGATRAQVATILMRFIQILA